MGNYAEQHEAAATLNEAAPTLGPRLRLWQRYCLTAGLLGLAGAAGLALIPPDGLNRVLFAYLVAFAFFLSLSLGALFFVALQHVTRAGWSVVVRRPAEVLAANFPALALLALPLLLGLPRVYRWVQPATDDTLVLNKAAYLNVPFFLGRLAFYFLVWTLLGRTFWKKSLRQDESGDFTLTLQMQKLSPAALLLFALTTQFAAVDLLMSLDPHWYSTIYGVYFFAGCVVGALAAMILILRLLQAAGALDGRITTEHYHDLGKLLFAFVFFWGYIAFSQYLLIWYANLPDETGWFFRRGATTVGRDANLFTWLGVALILLNFAAPFLGLLSRHAKRSAGALCFWCVLLLVMHGVDLFWLVRPELLTPPPPDFPAGATPAMHAAPLPVNGLDIAALLTCVLGVGGFYFVGVLYLAGNRSLVPLEDPRLKESLTFHQPI